MVRICRQGGKTKILEATKSVRTRISDKDLRQGVCMQEIRLTKGRTAIVDDKAAKKHFKEFANLNKVCS